MHLSPVPLACLSRAGKPLVPQRSAYLRQSATVRAASTRPNVEPATGDAPTTRARRTSAGVRWGAAERQRPATPETSAAADDVPRNEKTPPPGTAERLIPGAAIVTHRPRFDQE